MSKLYSLLSYTFGSFAIALFAVALMAGGPMLLADEPVDGGEDGVGDVACNLNSNVCVFQSILTPCAQNTCPLPTLSCYCAQGAGLVNACLCLGNNP